MMKIYLRTVIWNKQGADQHEQQITTKAKTIIIRMN